MTPQPPEPKPNPGSDAALKMGCTCPVVTNRRGRGMYTEADGSVMFTMVADCPIHGIPQKGHDDGE